MQCLIAAKHEISNNGIFCAWASFGGKSSFKHKKIFCSFLFSKLFYIAHNVFQDCLTVAVNFLWEVEC